MIQLDICFIRNLESFIFIFILQDSHRAEPTTIYISVAQPLYTRGTLNNVEESWRHTNPILHIVGGGGRWFTALIGRDNFL
jgi:hypothetical protein